MELSTDDPFVMMNLVGKRVRVQTIENNFMEGVVFVIDPIYKTIVLCDDNKIRMGIFLSMKSIEKISEDVVELKFLEKPPPRDIGSWKNVDERGEKILKWFKANYISAERKGETIIIDNYVSIEPPYTEETCYCSNTMILQNIQSILEKMPKDFE